MNEFSRQELILILPLITGEDTGSWTHIPTGFRFKTMYLQRSKLN